MINNRRNVSAYTGPLPKTLRPEDRFIDSPGPIYKTEEVLKLCNPKTISLWSDGSEDDAKFWGIDFDNLCTMIAKSLTSGKYENSQWCAKDKDLCGAWAACDSYEVIHPIFSYDEFDYVDCKVYIKFAISKTGHTLLSISNHPEGK